MPDLSEVNFFKKSKKSFSLGLQAVIEIIEKSRSGKDSNLTCC